MQRSNDIILKLYRRIGLFTCSSVFLLFFLGGLVRATGSGMGCPDWPKCFGLWAPPDCECKLPANYQEIYLQKRLQKVERFAKVLNGMGFHGAANRLLTDPSVKAPEEFHPVKAWIEYINRLFGVLSGLFALIYFGIMLRYRKIIQGKRWGLLGLVFLLLNGWLGSLVVATNLLPGVVTLHFLLSFMCLFAYMVSMHRAQSFRFEHTEILSSKKWFAVWAVVFVVLILGAWTREQVDQMRLAGTLYVDADETAFLGFGMLDVFSMDWLFSLHRYVPFVILGWMLWLIGKEPKIASEGGFKSKLRRPLWVISMICIVQIALGVIHIWFVIPSWAQVSHVVVGSALISYIFAVYLSTLSIKSTHS